MPKDPLANWPTVVEAAKRLKISKRTLQLKLARNEFTTAQRPRLGKKAATVIDPADLDRYLNERIVKPAVVPSETTGAIVKRADPGLRVRDAASFTPEGLFQALQSRETLEHRDTLNLQEAVRLKGYSVEYFELLNSQGKLPFCKIPGRRGRHVCRRDLDQLASLVDLPPWQSRKKITPDRVVTATTRLKGPSRSDHA